MRSSENVAGACASVERAARRVIPLRAAVRVMLRAASIIAVDMKFALCTLCTLCSLILQQSQSFPSFCAMKIILHHRLVCARLIYLCGLLRQQMSQNSLSSNMFQTSSQNPDLRSSPLTTFHLLSPWETLHLHLRPPLSMKVRLKRLASFSRMSFKVSSKELHVVQ